jgi:hypothetical protein
MMNILTTNEHFLIQIATDASGFFILTECVIFSGSNQSLIKNELLLIRYLKMN